MSTDQITPELLKRYFHSDARVLRSIPSLGGGSRIIGSGTKKFVLKEYDSTTKAKLQADIHDHLHSHGLPVPAIVKDTDGNRVNLFEDRAYVLFEFCRGREIGWKDDLSRIPRQLARDMALIIANMHKVCMEAGLAAPAFHQSAKAVTGNETLTAEYADAASLLGQLDMDNFSTTLIHSDLTRENIFVSDDLGRVTGLIDFDDAHLDYAVWDIAVLITQIFITKSWRIDWDGIDWFFDAYSENFKLSESERAALPALLKIRNIQLLAEVAESIKNETHELDYLKSIESSARTKLSLIEKGESQLSGLFLGAGVGRK